MRGIVRLTLIALLIAGCASSFAPPGETRGPSAPPAPRAPSGTGAEGGICYLVTDGEIGAIMGRQPLVGGSGFELGGVRFCNWSLYLDPVESVGLTLTRAASFEEGRLGGEQDVAGIGEDAYWSPGLDTLSVKKGAYNLTVLVWSESKDPKTAAIAVARLALSRLP